MTAIRCLTYPAQDFDYDDLVRRMSEAEMGGMMHVLEDAFRTIGKPVWRNEQRYFWTALFNAARACDIVWLWLNTQPHIRQFGPPEAAVHTMPQFASVMSLPVIGGPDDERLSDVRQVGPKKWPSEPTEDNFRQQAADLDAYLRAEGQKNPDNNCKTVREYVGTFYHSGTGRMHAQIQLTEGGHHALATREGFVWLMQHFGPDTDQNSDMHLLSI